MKIRSVLVLALLAGAATTAMASNDSTGASIPWQVSVPNSPSYGTDATLYDNGPLVTHPGAGFGGANTSALMTTFGGTIFGFGAQQVNGNRMADDFVVPVGQQWKIDSICFFTYQTGSTTNSTITGADMNIWSGAMPGTTLAGASTTIASNKWSGAYRTLDTDLTNNQRPIMVVEIDFGGLLLGAGQHWIDWSAAGSLASGPWAPAVSSISGLVSGNAMQKLGAAAFAPALDGTTQMALPFVVKGEIIPAPSSLALLGLGGLVAARRRR